MKRFKLSRSGSKALFTGTAVRHHKFNFSANPMRGGIRL